MSFNLLFLLQLHRFLFTQNREQATKDAISWAQEVNPFCFGFFYWILSGYSNLNSFWCFGKSHIVTKPYSDCCIGTPLILCFFGIILNLIALMLQKICTQAGTMFTAQVNLIKLQTDELRNCRLNQKNRLSPQGQFQ